MRVEQAIRTYKSGLFKSGMKKYQEDAKVMALQGYRVIATAVEQTRGVGAKNTLIVTYEREIQERR